MAQPVDQDGVSLARAYWLDVDEPVLDDVDPAMPRAAARIRTGSDVLKRDDEMSPGPRLGRSRGEPVLTSLQQVPQPRTAEAGEASTR